MKKKSCQPHLSTLAALDYPNLEIIAVDDRSQDSTGAILEEYARNHERFRAVHVKELPAGWLGKPHALQRAYEVSNVEWLLFTDADVRFTPDVLRRAASLAKERALDHLTLFGDVEMHGSWTYVGVGAFQLVKRSAYQAVGTHRRLTMEVVDDMKLGKMVKQGGFRSSVGLAQQAVSIRWHAGLTRRDQEFLRRSGLQRHARVVLDDGNVIIEYYTCH